MAEEERRGAISLPWYEINITQMNSRVELSEALNSVVGSMPKASVPFILFDEFDAALGGAESGWLSWFLAPRQDGTFRVGGAPTELKRAVYVFAGGTAESLADLGRSVEPSRAGRVNPPCRPDFHAHERRRRRPSSGGSAPTFWIGRRVLATQGCRHRRSGVRVESQSCGSQARRVARSSADNLGCCRVLAGIRHWGASLA